MRADLTGTVFAGFRVESLIGEGAMGTVYSAEDVASGRRVALKLLVLDIGLAQFRLTFDAETGEWLGFECGFEVLKEAGQRPVLDCDEVVAYLTDP
jgi:serine/threonine protein kinase